MDKLKRFFVNGLLLTFVAFASRYVAVRFNIYLSNKIGTVAMGLFTLVSSVYGFALTLATAGIGLATTKLVSEALGLGTNNDFPTETAIKNILKKSILFALSTSSLTALILFASAHYIGLSLLNDERTVSSLQILAFSLIPIALCSSMNGYFTAIRRVYKNAIVLIVGQTTRIALCIFLLSAVTAKDMESACVAIVCSTTLSEFLCFVLQAIMFYAERRKVATRNSATPAASSKDLSKKLMRITIPVALSAYMRSALVTIEHLLIPWGLEQSGNTRDLSLSAYGTLHSVVFPLVLFPSAISSSFAGLLVPEISESFAADDTPRIERISSRVMKTVLIYAIGIAGILMCFSTELGHVLFPTSNAAKYILMIAPLIPIMYLDTSVDSILKGLGYQFYTMVINIVDALLSVILVWILLPRLGISGYIITVYFTEIINATLSITKMLLVTKIKVKLFDWIVKPIGAIILSTFVMRCILGKLCIFACSRSEIFLHMAICAVIYFLLLILFRSISPKKLNKLIQGFFRA